MRRGERRHFILTFIDILSIPFDQNNCQSVWPWVASGIFRGGGGKQFWVFSKARQRPQKHLIETEPPKKFKFWNRAGAITPITTPLGMPFSLTNKFEKQLFNLLNECYVKFIVKTIGILVLNKGTSSFTSNSLLIRKQQM